MRIRSVRRRRRSVRRNPFSSQRPAPRRRRVVRRRRARRNPPALALAPRRRRRRSSLMRRIRRPRRTARAVVRLARRRVRRFRRGGRRSGGMGIKSILNQDVLKIAAGAVGGSMLASVIMNQFGPMKRVGNTNNFTMKGADEFVLPGLRDPKNGPTMAIAYTVGIPILGAIIANKMGQRDVAKGMVVGAAVLGINLALAKMQTVSAPASAPVTGTSEYLAMPNNGRPRLIAGVGDMLTRQPGAFSTAFSTGR